MDQERKDVEDIILDFLNMIGADLNKEKILIDTDSHKLQKFFYEFRKKMPDELPNVYFNSDPDFPYSPEIEQAFLNLQDYGFLKRPNPSLKRFQFQCVPRETRIPEKMKQFINSFKEKFVIDDTALNGC